MSFPTFCQMLKLWQFFYTNNDAEVKEEYKKFLDYLYADQLNISITA